METSELIICRTQKLNAEVSKLIPEISKSFDGYVYNPLDYAWDMHRQFLEKYILGPVDVLFLGMNPGPFGMMQTGIPFGEINVVKSYLKVEAPIYKPEKEHPSRPVLGLKTTRSEVSGRRLWGLFSSRFPEPLDFCKFHAVFNYCPLGFLLNTKLAKNETPDHLPKQMRDNLDSVCLEYLSDVIEILKPSYLIGVGKYAMEKLSKVSCGQVVDWIIHPSPGNPMANNGWDEKTTVKLVELGIWK